MKRTAYEHSYSCCLQCGRYAPLIEKRQFEAKVLLFLAAPIIGLTEYYHHNLGLPEYSLAAIYVGGLVGAALWKFGEAHALKEQPTVKDV